MQYDTTVPLSLETLVARYKDRKTAMEHYNALKKVWSVAKLSRSTVKSYEYPGFIFSSSLLLRDATPIPTTVYWEHPNILKPGFFDGNLVH